MTARPDEGTGHRRPGATRRRALFLAPAAVATVFVALDVLHNNDVPPFLNSAWRLDRDRSAGETAGYVALLTAAARLARLSWRRRSDPVYGAWAAVLTLVALDDMLELHESGGRLLATWLSIPPTLGLRPYEVGELLAWITMAGALATFLVAGHLRSTRVGRRDSVRLGALVALIAVFGVVVDLGHTMLTLGTPGGFDYRVGLFESWGELAAMVGVLAYVVHLRSRARAVPERG